MSVKRYKGALPLSSTKAFAREAIPFSYRLRKLNPTSIQCRLAFRNFHFIFDPEITALILKDTERFKKSFVYDYLALILGNGLLTAEHEQWKNNRRKMQPVFSPKGIDSLFELMDRKIRDEVDTLRSTREFFCLDFMRNLAAKVVIYSLFSEEKNAAGLSDLINSLVQYANYRLKTPLSLPSAIPSGRNKKFKKDLQRLHDFIQNIIEQRQGKSEKPDDFLTYLMEIKAEGQPYFSGKQLKDELVTLYIAGQETTASVLTFALYELIRNPDVAQKLREEVVSVEELNLQTIHRLKYTEQVLLESMRKYPPGWAISREAVVDVVQKGVEIKKGDSILLPVYLLHHREDIWPDPVRFMPERFNEKPNDHFYMPFGSGPRICIGKYFAMMEMKIILYYLFRNFEFDLSADFKLELQTPMTLCPKKDFVLGIEQI